MITITLSGTLEFAVLLLIITSCMYTSLALIVSAIEHIKKFRNKEEKEDAKKL